MVLFIRTQKARGKMKMTYRMAYWERIGTKIFRELHEFPEKSDGTATKHARDIIKKANERGRECRPPRTYELDELVEVIYRKKPAYPSDWQGRRNHARQNRSLVS